MFDRISIVVPVYNAEDFLCNSIDCILQQTFRNFELILVDDGSKDRSGVICDEYAKNDERVRVVHKLNAGASEARNTGIDNSSEELITFIDSDDVISKDYLLQLLYDYQKSQEVDFVLQGMQQKWSDHDISFRMNDGIYNCDNCLFYDNVYLNNFSGPYCKLFRRSILLKYNLRFSPMIIYGEDFDFMLRYLKYCKVVVASSATNYFYMMHQESVSSKIYQFDKELSGLCQIFSSFDVLIEKSKSEAVIKMKRDSINAYIWRVIYSNYRHEYIQRQRLANFRSIPSEVLVYFNENYNADTVFTKIVKLLLVGRNFLLLDYLLRIRL